jgi:hypothetical protein
MHIYIHAKANIDVNIADVTHIPSVIFTFSGRSLSFELVL